MSEDQRKEFEGDAEPYGFDLTRATNITDGEPWAEYSDWATGHRWAGWLAARSTPKQGEASQQVEPGWQPIETAPRDGSYLQVWPPTWTGVSSCAMWDEDRHAKRPRPFWSRTDDYGRKTISRNTEPTHWMPTCAAPKEPKP